jgi:pimeloyl-ACP methyl ester carboxylesterase
VIIYESIFGSRFENKDMFTFSASDYDDLNVQRSDFLSDESSLAGYKYSKENTEAKGVVIISHGLGGGGHYTYMPFIDFFTSNDYYVFAYDATAHYNSPGDSTEGLPQGIIDLDSAINHVYTIKEYENLPIMIMGHSWGAFSAGNVLNLHPEISAVILFAGFNESEDQLLYQSQKYIGGIANILLPSVELYERIKFGSELTSLSAVNGLKNSNAQVLVVHSKNDVVVPMEYGYDKFYNEFKDSPRFDFILYENRGHTNLFYSEEANEYRMELLNAYLSSDTIESYESFLAKNLNKKKYFELDNELLNSIMATFDKALSK